MKHALPLLLALLVLAACRRHQPGPVDAAAFMPLQTGNYWKVNDDDYMQVAGDTLLNGQRYSLIQSVQNRDGTMFQGNSYFRLDGTRLLQAYGNSPETTVRADFGLQPGQTFPGFMEQHTLREKTDEQITFRYPCGLCSASGATYDLTFRRGRGWVSRNVFTGGTVTGNPPFTEVRINGVVYR